MATEIVPLLAEECGLLDGAAFLAQASLVLGAIGVVVPLVWLAAARALERDWHTLASFALPAIRLSLWLISALVLLHGLVFVQSTHLAWLHLFGRVNYIAIGCIALGTLFAWWQVTKAALTSSKNPRVETVAFALADGHSRKLFGLVRDLAAKLDVSPPDHIVVGLEPSFHVTRTEVSVSNSAIALTGQTLHISLPLTRLFTVPELAAVIGHELAHLRDENDVYSLRFARVYVALERAVKLPGNVLTRFFACLIPTSMMTLVLLDFFSASERGVSRRREQQADEAGAQAASPMAMATALVKFNLLGQFWNQLIEQNATCLRQEHYIRNLSMVLTEWVRQSQEQLGAQDVLEHVSGCCTAHPRDTHPLLSERIERLGVNPAAIRAQSYGVPQESAVALIDNAEAIEEHLTLHQHMLMSEIAVAEGSEEEDVLMGRHLPRVN